MRRCVKKKRVDNNQARSWPIATRFLPSRSTRPSVLYTNLLVSRIVKKIRLFDTRSALLRVAMICGVNYNNFGAENSRLLTTLDINFGQCISPKKKKNNYFYQSTRLPAASWLLEFTTSRLLKLVKNAKLAKNTTAMDSRICTDLAVFRSLNFKSRDILSVLEPSDPGSMYVRKLWFFPFFSASLKIWFRIVVVKEDGSNSYFYPSLLYVDTDGTSCM